MEASKMMESEVIKADGSFIPQSKKTIKAIIPHRNKRYINFFLLKSNLKRKEQTKRSRFNEIIGYYGKKTVNGTLRSLSEVLKSSKRAQQLQLEYRPFRNESSRAEYICDIVKRMRSLKDLTIFLSSQLQMSEEDLKRSVKGFKNLASLESLSFEMRDLNSITNSGMKALCSALKSLKSLKRISFGFNSRIMGIIIHNLGKALKTLVLLESITLKFLKSQEIVHLDLLYLGQTFHFLPCLKSLNLDFSRSGLSELEVQGLSKGLRGLSGLKDFVLNLKSCSEVTDKAVQNVVESLGSLISLQSFSLNLQSCHGVGEEGLDSLWQGIQNLTSLTNIELSFSCWEAVLNESLQGLDQVLKNLSLLKSISLDFGYSYFGDVGMKYLVIALSNLISLKNLTLNFGRSEVTDIDIEKLAQGLKNLSSLESIAVSLKECKRHTKIGVKTLVEAIKTINSLKNINLDFSLLRSNCCFLNDLVLYSIGEDLKILTSLKSISIYLQNCDVTRKGKNDLRRVLRAMASSPSVAVYD